MVQESNRRDKRIKSPGNIFVLHLGGVGDLVLFSEPYAALRAAYPGAAITMACRAANAAVFDLYPIPPDVVLPLEIDPYTHGQTSPELISDVRRMLDALPSGKPDVYIGGGLRPPWLSWIVAAKLQAGRAVMASQARPPLLARELLTPLGLQEANFEYVPVQAGGHERDRYRALLQHLDVPPGGAIDLRLPDAASQHAAAILASAELSQNGYLASFPVSSPLTPEKRWPLERYTQVFERMHAKSELPILLLGDKHEAAEIEEYANTLRQLGIRTSSFIGEPPDISTTAALLSKARAYFGNDTGLAHLAAAFGVRGVTVYGGGTWPMYAPWSPGSIGVVNPLPCFGCYWDCTFGRGVCVESVPADDVFSALSRVLKGKGSPQPEVIELNTVSADEQAVIADATKRYRALQVDRAARLEALEQSKHELVEAERKGKELQAAADERLEALRETKDALARAVHENHRLEELERSAESARQNLEERDRIIGELQAALEDRDAHAKRLQNAAAELEAAVEEREGRLSGLAARDNAGQTILETAQEREKVIAELSAALEETDRRAKSLQEAADLRGQKLQEIEAALDALQDIGKVAQEREGIIQELRGALEETDRRATSLQEAADLRGQKAEELSDALEKQNQRVHTLETDAKNFQEMHATAQEREKIIFELNSALDERSKNAQKILEVAAEREALIQELSAAVEDRESRIAQLERVAEERLVALKETDEGLRAVTAEADRRAIMLAEVTSLLKERTDES